jgi:hypothetical protein
MMDMTEPAAKSAQADPPPVDGRAAIHLGRLFYLAVVLIALAGQTGAAQAWLEWPVLAALGAVAALELGGVTLAVWADYRQRLGERAYVARTLSGATAVFAVLIQWVGHQSRIQAGFFAGMSALGYSVYLIQSAARRRDQLRADGMLPPVPPAYGLGQWVRRPWLTRRARALALVDPSLGLYGSLAAAREEIRAERRNVAIAGLLAQKIGEGKDPLEAKIAINVFDMSIIAKEIADTADYAGLAESIAAGLTPRRVLNGQPSPRRATNRPDGEPAPQTEPSTAIPTAPKPTVRQPSKPRSRQPRAGTVHTRSAVNNARQLRDAYPGGLPSSLHQVRLRMGWQFERAKKAVAAYGAGADLRHPTADTGTNRTEATG